MENRRYIFHFDIRNTVLVADSVTNVSIEESLNSYLTSVAWGTVDSTNGRWTWCHDEPSLDKPQSNAVSYYKYLESKIVRTPFDRLQFRKVTGNFTDTEIGRRFKSVYEKYIALLVYPHPYHPYLCMKGSHSDKFYHYLLPSFVNFLCYLAKNDLDYKVVFRTFGMDAPTVLKSVQLVTEGSHPAFPVSTPCVVSHVVDNVVRNDDKIILRSNNRLISDEFEIQRHLSSDDCRISAVVDDFHYWLKNEYLHSCGKPFWLDPNDNNECQQIFFDDNVRFGDIESIVDVRTWGERKNGSTNSTQQTFSSMNEFEFFTLKDVHLVQVNLLEAIEDLDYFINKFILCSNNFTSKNL